MQLITQNFILFCVLFIYLSIADFKNAIYEGMQIFHFSHISYLMRLILLEEIVFLLDSLYQILGKCCMSRITQIQVEILPGVCLFGMVALFEIRLTFGKFSTISRSEPG